RRSAPRGGHSLARKPETGPRSSSSDGAVVTRPAALGDAGGAPAQAAGLLVIGYPRERRTRRLRFEARPGALPGPVLFFNLDEGRHEAAATAKPAKRSGRVDRQRGHPLCKRFSRPSRAQPGRGGRRSGKATQCERLVSTYGLTHLSTGELLRTEIALGAGSAYRLRRTMLNNDLVPVADANAMRARLLDSPGFLINGCPKDREQAMAFEMMLVPCRVVVFLDVPEDVMWQRLMRRGRRTDQEEVIQKKIKTFREKTLSVVKYFERQGKLVDGTGTVSEVFSRFATRTARRTEPLRTQRSSPTKTSDSIPSSPTKGVKAGSTDSSSPSHKHKKKQANPGQKHQKQHGHQSQQKSDRDAAEAQGSAFAEASSRQERARASSKAAGLQEKQHHQQQSSRLLKSSTIKQAKQQTPEKHSHQAAKAKNSPKAAPSSSKAADSRKHHQTAKPNAFDKNHQSKKADQQKI
uniref:Guanylate kinase-like domain-containing protein n=1 Tax=Macrostomum lignano TaxID=282301 RepID=A0A1I8JR68_9PLAT